MMITINKLYIYYSDLIDFYNISYLSGVISYNLMYDEISRFSQQDIRPESGMKNGNFSWIYKG